MSLVRRLDEAVAFVRARAPLRPAIGVVLGSGLGAFADALEDATAVPFGEIPHFAASTVVGHGGALVLGRSQGRARGRDEGPGPLLRGLRPRPGRLPGARAGAARRSTLVVTNAAGAINPAFAPGDLMVIEDHINLLGNPLLGPNDEALGPRFPDMTEAYDRDLRDVAETACRAVRCAAPRRVRRAHRALLRDAGGDPDAARRSAPTRWACRPCPEVIAARHMGMRVLGLSCVTNMAAGVTDRKLDHQEVLETGERVNGPARGARAHRRGGSEGA